MKTILPVLFLLLFMGTASSQSYNTVGGLRMGTDWGLTVKQRVYNNITAELLIQSSLVREEVNLTLLGALHQPIISRRFNLYYGGGIHKGWSNQMDGDGVLYEDPFGIDLIGGLEFTIGQLSLSYDFKPAVNISGGEKTFYSQTGLSFRYVFLKRDQLSWEPDNKTFRKKRRERRKRQRQRRRN